jgi:hypothetical protein
MEKSEIDGSSQAWFCKKLVRNLFTVKESIDGSKKVVFEGN